jgi:hypothetical protein
VLSETACFGGGFELLMDILRITVLSNASTVYNYQLMLRMNS